MFYRLQSNEIIMMQLSQVFCFFLLVGCLQFQGGCPFSCQVKAINYRTTTRTSTNKSAIRRTRLFTTTTSSSASSNINGKSSSSKSLQNTLLQSSNHSHDIEILSEDPKIFLVHNFLSCEECQAYISKLSQVSPDRVKQSNAPQVSLQTEKLWPLPFLSLGAGVPSLLRLYEQVASDPNENIRTIQLDRILSVTMPPILIALSIVVVLMVTLTTILQRIANQSARTSESVALNTPQDCEFIQPLVEKASNVTNHPWTHWEAPVLTKYSQGALFSSHNDASATRGSEWADLGGQRVVTVITYLNTCERGGATKFDVLGFQVQPRQGSALVFFPADAQSLKADGRTVHQSLPAVDEKFIVQLFGRHQRVPPPLGIPDTFANIIVTPRQSIKNTGCKTTKM